MRLSRLFFASLTIVLVCSSLTCSAATTTAAEQARAAQWAAAKFQDRIVPAENRNYLLPDRGGMERNQHLGRLLRIGSTDFSNGLFMGQTTRITVHLASPAKSFEATVGLDGRSSGCGYSNQKQQFVVQVGDETVARSPEIKVGQAGVLLQANLGGTSEFRISDGSVSGDSWCNQGVLGDARVLLLDGSSVRLGDLPVGPGVDAKSTTVPFSFTYGGKPSYALLGSWIKKSSSHAIDENRMEYNLSWTDPDTGLIVEMVSRTWRDYPVVEWTLYLENTGNVSTPIIENVSAIDTDFSATPGNQFALHHFRGSPAGPKDFEPFLTNLENGNDVHLATSGGRSTDASMCYFNLEESGQGVIVALGWPGQWAADVTRSEGNSARVRAGQELTHFRLLPHERVRTPLVALLFWNGSDWMRGQNLWRSWMLTDNMPRFANGKIEPHMAGSSSQWFDEMVHATETSQKQFIDGYHAAGLKPDLWWMDAGWYSNDGDWWNTGTWKINPTRFPNGLKPITDYAHKMGLESIVWFELERVTSDSALWKEHPEWLLHDAQEEERGQRLLNLGNPDAEKWVVDFLERTIREQGIDVYRIDFNIAPLPFWRNHDAPDRQGITEIRYVTGFLDYLDKLHKLFPRLQIDTCASGGRRDDLETLRRAVPMHRSDYVFEPTGSQNIGYGLAHWVPYFGAPSDSRDNYVFRSSWSPQINVGWDVRRTDLDYEWIRQAVDQWRSVAPEMLGDYYPLLPYDSSEDAWMAWQFYRPESRTGAIQVFRRARSGVITVKLKLKGLDAGARYSMTDLDTRSTKIYSADELQNVGFEVTLSEPMSSAVLKFARQDQ
ncbi:MAG: alpha-galactosidase [Terracidiphilus sp.]|nr:alpha-galactosidase [Terracidiphilus sp.]